LKVSAAYGRHGGVANDFAKLRYLEAAARLRDELDAQLQAGSRTVGAADALAAAAGYFAHNAERMKYDVFAALQFPTGSGMQWTMDPHRGPIHPHSALAPPLHGPLEALWKYLDRHGRSSTQFTSNRRRTPHPSRGPDVRVEM